MRHWSRLAALLPKMQTTLPRWLGAVSMPFAVRYLGRSIYSNRGYSCAWMLSFSWVSMAVNGQVSWSRAARTDKGVSAIGQVRTVCFGKQFDLSLALLAAKPVLGAEVLVTGNAVQAWLC